MREGVRGLRGAEQMCCFNRSVGGRGTFGKWGSSCFSEVDRRLVIDVLQRFRYLFSSLDIGSDYHRKHWHSDVTI